MWLPILGFIYHRLLLWFMLLMWPSNWIPTHLVTCPTIPFRNHFILPDGCHDVIVPQRPCPERGKGERGLVVLKLPTKNLGLPINSPSRSIYLFHEASYSSSCMSVIQVLRNTLLCLPLFMALTEAAAAALAWWCENVTKRQVRNINRKLVSLEGESANYPSWQRTTNRRNIKLLAHRRNNGGLVEGKEGGIWSFVEHDRNQHNLQGNFDWGRKKSELIKIPSS